MNPEKWQKVEEIFHAALERDANERSSFLQNACQGDENLLKEVNRFISAHEKANSFIQKPILPDAIQLLSDQDETPSLIGKKLNHYEIISSLGVGGMGQVYLAWDTRLERNVALKVLLPEIAKDEDRVRRFKLEAKAVSSLNHPNIITIFEIGETENQLFIVYEYVEGKTLREKITCNQLTVASAIKTAEQAAEALAAAHAVGIIHRDIKPENIMIRQDGYVKVLDFGLAKRRFSEIDSEIETFEQIKTQKGLIFGSVQYMSPEQARGQETDERTDVWSLGVVLYEMLTGKNPFAGETISDSIGAILHLESEPINKSVSIVPEQLQKIVEKSLKKDISERYQSIEEFVKDLKILRETLKDNISSRRIEQSLLLEKTVELIKQVTDENSPLIQETATQNLQVVTKENEAKGKRQSRKWLLIPLAIFTIVAVFVFFNYFRPILFPSLSNVTENSNKSPVAKSDKLSNIWSYNLQTKESKQLTSNSKIRIEDGLTQMPDGRILYTRQTDSNGIQIFVADETGNNEKQLTLEGEKNIKPIITPDGKYILYITVQNNSTKIIRMNANDNYPVQLADTVDIASSIQITPNSKTVIYTQSGDKKILMRISIDGGKSTALIPDSQTSDSHPGISRDGKYLAYLSNYYDKATAKFKDLVSVVEFNKGEIGEPIVEEEFDFASTMQWSPDNKSLCFIGRQEIDNLWCYSIDDQKEKALTNFDSGKIDYFTWSSDGKRLFIGRGIVKTD